MDPTLVLLVRRASAEERALCFPALHARAQPRRPPRTARLGQRRPRRRRGAAQARSSLGRRAALPRVGRGRRQLRGALRSDPIPAQPGIVPDPSLPGSFVHVPAPLPAGVGVGGWGGGGVGVGASAPLSPPPRREAAVEAQHDGGRGHG